jgi:dTDP-4-amino-4,6-dideoxygalactose transaminase
MQTPFYGQPADMPAIRAIADKHNLQVTANNVQGIDGHGGAFMESLIWK